MKYVIIGNSTAAIGCIEGIRSIDKEGEIFVISKEPHHTYSRPLISYYMQGKTDSEKMKYRPGSFYADNNVQLMLGHEAQKIDAEKKEVVLENGEAITYDKLLLATGSYPFIPPITGLEKVKNKFTFMSKDDAEALSEKLDKKSKVLIIGAGLIGLKCAEGIFDRVASVTVVDFADRILPNVLDMDSAKMVQTYLETKGLAFILSNSVAEFSENSALLSNGQTIMFDVAVIAVGVRPSTNLLCDLGCDAKRGIRTNQNLETAIADIYAAGDCTLSLDISSGESKILALLPNAYLQGEVAGINMACGQKLYENPIPMNATKLFGLAIVTAGSYVGDEYIVTGEYQYKKLVTKDNLFKGYILIGNIERAGIYTSLIMDKTPLDSIDFDLIKDKPQLMAFSKTQRQQKLGGLKNA
ncbi:MAG: FAD-dependent oxidoreductase [Eubacteriales bacterium]